MPDTVKVLLPTDLCTVSVALQSLVRATDEPNRSTKADRDGTYPESAVASHEPNIYKMIKPYKQNVSEGSHSFRS